MALLRDAPIRQKLLVIVLATTAVALLLAGFAVLATDAVLFRAALQRDLLALANIAGDNSSAALLFEDQKVAGETLNALRARRHLVAACLYREGNALFASYIRDGAAQDCPPPQRNDDARFDRAGITVSHPILVQGSRGGTIVLRYDLGEVWERTQLYSAIVIAILLLSIVVALALSTRLRDAIALPISRLATAAASISDTGDYTVRVQKDSADELGILVDAFNNMLARIQSRDIEVQNARNSLETTLSSIGDAVVSTDRSGRIVFANPVALSLLRWPAAEVAGKQIDEVFRIVNEFSRKKVESPVEKVLREGAVAGLANGTILIARDGTEIPIDDSAAPIRLNGQTAGVVLVFRDITERRRAQQDSAYLAAIVESSDDAIIGKSPYGIIQSWNAGAERLYGYTAEDAIGRGMVELCPPDRRHEESEILESLRCGEAIFHFETVRLRKDGTAIDVSLTISPIRNKAGEIIGVSHVARDITEQKRTAEQMRETAKLESLGVLAGGIAHDFNNLLTGVLGNASLAIEDLPPGSPARPAIEAVLSASERAAELARQMLAYSGKGRFVLERLNLSDRVRETVALIRATIPSAVALRLELDDNLPWIEADAAQIQQVIMNIIINAGEAIPEGTVGTVTIRTRREPAGGNRNRPAGLAHAGAYVCFEVSDTGTGMDEQTQARIFDPFFTTKFTGRGLGLAAVLGIIRGHNGSIQVFSAPGEGTTFRVWLPEMETTKAGSDGLEREPVFEDPHGNSIVLIVDDEELVRDVARQTLERYGYHVLVAEDGSRALDLFRRSSGQIACVVLDLTMPVMSGAETLTRMKGVRDDVPIVLSSGFNQAQAVDRFEGQGLAGFLQKPYTAERLLEIVKRAILQSPKAGRDVCKGLPTS